jgi:hypothetical protein
VQRPLLLVGVAVALLVPRPVAAQPVSHVHRFDIAVGIISSSVLDGAASPLRYGGVLPALDLAYGVQGAAGRLRVRAGLGWGTLTSEISHGDVPREEETAAWLEIEYLRSLSDGTARARWSLGGRLAALAAVRDHYSADPTRAEAQYAFGVVECAPVVAVERPLWSGTLAVRAGVSVVALVSRPYTDLRALSQVPLRVAPVWRFRAASLSVAYARPVGTRVDLVWTYRARIERLSDPQPFRAAAQALSLGFSIRLAGGA